jgi:glutamate-1-semialdehyde 2,1-aminomutase
MVALATLETLQADWSEGRPASKRLSERARSALPSGVTHDNRYQEPHSLFVERASGSRKWDVDGNEYVDYWMGHGALLLGHSHPAIVAAVARQLEKGTHYGASHELEVRWAELVREIVPSGHGGLVKFFSSGTEATLMAVRLARAFTKRDKILKIQGHFHGWNDYATMAMAAPFDRPISVGIPRGVEKTIVSVPPNDLGAIENALRTDSEIGGLIMIPAGTREYLQGVRRITQERGVVLIFDEVVTGFRYAPGGAQEYFGVVPDLTALAKILAGGLPGGAVAGRAEILRLLELHPRDFDWTRFGRIPHPGTFNGNPLSAAAGVACLEIVRDPAVQTQANANAETLRAAITSRLESEGMRGEAGGLSSIVEIALPDFDFETFDVRLTFRLAMQLHGVDVSGPKLIVSTAHTGEDIARTAEAFGRALTWLSRLAQSAVNNA